MTMEETGGYRRKTNLAKIFSKLKELEKIEKKRKIKMIFIDEHFLFMMGIMHQDN